MPETFLVSILDQVQYRLNRVPFFKAVHRGRLLNIDPAPQVSRHRIVRVFQVMTFGQQIQTSKANTLLRFRKVSFAQKANSGKQQVHKIGQHRGDMTIFVGRRLFMFENKALHHLEEMGEFGLIDHLTSFIENSQKGTIKGPGDDAAVISPEDELVVTTDMLTEGVHFDLMYTPLKHLGYKAVMVNISDIVAMNAIPSHITVALALSSKFSLEAIEELYSGMLMACKKYQIDLIGGDMVSSKSGLVISITALGHQKKEKIVYRKGAKPGDLLCVSGDLGGAYLGLQLLEREKRVFLANPGMQPELDGYDYLIGRQLKPEARIDVIKLLEERGVLPTSMIDISDGLSSEIKHLCKHSELGIQIYEEKLPLDPTAITLAAEFNLDVVTCALNGGEDYELLFTIRQEDYDKVKGEPDISIIGHCTENKGVAQIVNAAGQSFDLKAQGWKAF